MAHFKECSALRRCSALEAQLFEQLSAIIAGISSALLRWTKLPKPRALFVALSSDICCNFEFDSNFPAEIKKANFSAN